jgi:hypothetical protein
MTYLQLVNSVLRRMRENEVTSFENSTDSYVKLIGEFVNDARRIVEDAWDWSALRKTITVTTSNTEFSYSITGTNNSFKILDVINDTSNFFMRPASSSWMNNAYLIQEPISGSPEYYSWNGVDASGNALVDVYPKPDQAYTLRFNIVDRGDPFTADADKLVVPSAPVIQYAVALASRERGETGGTSSQELFSLADTTLADAVAFDAARFPSETVWTPC